MSRPDQVSRTFRIRRDLVEALEETAEELVVGRNLLLEHALEDYLARLELPTRDPVGIEPVEEISCPACDGRHPVTGTIGGIKVGVCPELPPNVDFVVAP